MEPPRVLFVSNHYIEDGVFRELRVDCFDLVKANSGCANLYVKTVLLNCSSRLIFHYQYKCALLYTHLALMERGQRITGPPHCI
jgi:hypothetical protein